MLEKSLKKRLHDLQEREGFFRFIVEHSSDAMVVVDHTRRVRFLNPAALRLFPYPAEQMLGQRFPFPLHTDTPQEIDLCPDKRELRIAEMRVVEASWQGETFYVITLRDITEQVRLRERLRSLVLIDDLTGLYNRRGFLTLAEQQLKVAQRKKQGLVLVFTDLDDLKQINDTFGHQEGDRALVDVATILKATFRQSDIIARLGGDEFVVLALEAHASRTEALTTRLQKNIKKHNTHAQRPYTLSMSIGTVRYNPEFPCSIEDLLAQADAHMYARKQNKREP
ncbi:MAG: sensor domain-containing diguanylate cyclase [Nitrospinota bacterium]|nr:MAG: sensor domain-containing diguanylate cyclase [Nitrospinota bacterium]